MTEVRPDDVRYVVVKFEVAKCLRIGEWEERTDAGPSSNLVGDGENNTSTTPPFVLGRHDLGICSEFTESPGPVN